jgi:hypothetical protein
MPSSADFSEFSDAVVEIEIGRRDDQVLHVQQRQKSRIDVRRLPQLNPVLPEYTVGPWQRGEAPRNAGTKSADQAGAPELAYMGRDVSFVE